ncbi:hypothetical protein GL58_10920 [Comamonas testosteroni]|uniref:Uncharacterized protein n=1 Tax=Comamonas testosteroni TaxID=285 RepID=A0A0L7MDQ6_COMTE|nr:hypothetical protein GL58_10920 [Comamonas testosteroni]
MTQLLKVDFHNSKHYGNGSSHLLFKHMFQTQLQETACTCIAAISFKHALVEPIGFADEL